MDHGGVKINNQAAQVIRFAGLIMPVMLTFYGLLIKYGVVAESHYVSDVVFLSIVIPWVGLSAFYFLYTKRSRLFYAASLIVTHIFAAAYILFVSGLTMPFIAGWILLFIASYAYFSRTGLWLSILVLVNVAIAGTFFHSNPEIAMLSNTLIVLSLLIVGLTAVTIGQIQEPGDSDELLQSKAHETVERERILTLVNNLADAILSTDENGVIRIYNAAILNLLDTNTGLDGRHIDEILNLLDQDMNHVTLLEDMKTAKGVIVRDDLTMTIAEETLRLEVTYSPIRTSYSVSQQDRKNDGYILILRDITKSKSLEEERDEFISVVSHELRTPITIAEGTISNVQVMMDRPNIAKDILQKGVATAHDQVVFLAKMVNDLSTLSRAERGVADDTEEIDVKALANGLYSEYGPQAEQKGLHLNLDLGASLGKVSASRLYLQELLQNFITNAIKYTKEGSVTLRITHKQGNIIFEVKDTGIGISKTDQAKIFNKFYRSEDYRTRETGGTGLGLYVATKLAKKLGCKIEIESRLNHGSSFSFTLPKIAK